MKKLIIFIPFLLAFNYQPGLNDWELNNDKISAYKISIRSKLSKNKVQCEFEKSNKLFPVGCFELLANMKLLNPGYNFSEIEDKLNKNCVDNISKIVNLNQIRQIEEKLIEQTKCKFLFINQKEIIKYKIEI